MADAAATDDDADVVVVVVVVVELLLIGDELGLVMCFTSMSTIDIVVVVVIRFLFKSS
jgi:hypothetical protein